MAFMLISLPAPLFTQVVLKGWNVILRRNGGNNTGPYNTFYELITSNYFSSLTLRLWAAITTLSVTLMSVWCLHSSVCKVYLHIILFICSHISSRFTVHATWTGNNIAVFCSSVTKPSANHTLVGVFQMCDVDKFRNHAHILVIYPGIKQGKRVARSGVTASLQLEAG
jgi:hypothetical protein